MTQLAILHLMNGFGDASISRIVQRLVQHLGDRDYSWHIGGLSGLGDMQAEFKRLGTQVVDFSAVRAGRGNLLGRIRAYVAANQVRLVHTHTPRTRLAAALALVGKAGTIHLATEHLLYTPEDRRWGLLYALLDRFALYLPDHLVAVSHKMQREIISLPGISARRVTAIQNAIDCDSYYVPHQRDACRAEFSLMPESPVIGYAGRIEKVKSLDLLLEGFCRVTAHYPQARLMLAGEGQEKRQLEAFAAALGVSQSVIWTGFRQDIPRLLAAMDVYVQPSANEGLCLSILEAMAAGKAVIATNVGAAEEVLTHQKTGILIPPGSPSAVGAAIVDLLNDPKNRTALAQAARDHVVQEFGVQRMVEEYRQLYEVLALQ